MATRGQPWSQCVWMRRPFSTQDSPWSLAPNLVIPPHWPKTGDCQSQGLTSGSADIPGPSLCQGKWQLSPTHPHLPQWIGCPSSKHQSQPIKQKGTGLAHLATGWGRKLRHLKTHTSPPPNTHCIGRNTLKKYIPDGGDQEGWHHWQPNSPLAVTAFLALLLQ